MTASSNILIIASATAKPGKTDLIAEPPRILTYTVIDE
jgi:hypothetical protein